MNERKFFREREVKRELYYEQVDILSDKLIETKNYVEKKPYCGLEELNAILDKDERVRKLLPEQIGTFKESIKKFIDNRDLVHKTVEKFENNPTELFNKILEKKTSEKVELRESPASLCFVVSEDLIEKHTSSIPEGTIRGCHLVVPDDYKDKRFVGLVSLINKSQDRNEIQYAIEHEGKHAFFENYIRAAYPLKFEWKEEPKDLKDFVQNLKLVKRNYMSAVLESEYAGDIKKVYLRYKDIHASYIQKEILKKGENILSPEDQKQLTEVTTQELDSYIRWFYLRQTVKEQLSSSNLNKEKIDALLFIIPPEKIERALYFIGIDPKIWLKQWNKENPIEKLKKEEKDEYMATATYEF